jgi:hypothetical protein
MKKMKVVTVSMSDDEIEMYQRLAKQEGKNFSDFVGVVNNFVSVNHDKILN